MPSPEEDFWIKMSVKEISTQVDFANLAYANLTRHDLTLDLRHDVLFSSIHSFLSNCAIISKMLKACKETTSIGDELDIPADSPIHQRRFRNHLEHYDERLQSRIRDVGLKLLVGRYRIGSKSKIRNPNVVFIRHYDPATSIFTFIDDEIVLSAMHVEAMRIKEIADQWIANHIA
jgi:hypothetical protein